MLAVSLVMLMYNLPTLKLKTNYHKLVADKANFDMKVAKTEDAVRIKNRLFSVYVLTVSI